MCWYVMQVFTGREKETVGMCRSRTEAGTIKEIFVPEYEYMKKYSGQWHRETGVLFPGYIFVRTEEIDALRQMIKRIPEYTKLLDADGEILPMSQADRMLMVAMLDERRVFRMSEGYIEGDRIRVTSGPLKGREGWIRKIDRHKRRAILDIDMLGRTIRTTAGLEIVSKKNP